MDDLIFHGLGNLGIGESWTPALEGWNEACNGPRGPLKILRLRLCARRLCCADKLSYRVHDDSHGKPMNGQVAFFSQGLRSGAKQGRGWERFVLRT